MKTKTIWKYPLEIHERQTLEIPGKFTPLCVQLDQKTGTPALWCLVDPEADRETHVLYMVGTGHPCEEHIIDACYLATVQTGPFVWHYFWETGAHYRINGAGSRSSQGE